MQFISDTSKLSGGLPDGACLSSPRTVFYLSRLGCVALAMTLRFPSQ